MSNPTRENLIQRGRKRNLFDLFERSRHTPQELFIGDIKVFHFFNSHSIYDSHMFLIEADGKRIWHMGDYRQHGYLGKGLLPTLKKYTTDIDVFITEGTMLKRDRNY